MYILCINRITTRFMDVTNTWQTGDKIWENVTNFWPNAKTLGITGFLRCQKSDKICPMWQKMGQKCDKCQNMHKYTILCIKMNKNPKNVTNWRQKLDKICHNMGEMWQTGDKNWTTFVRIHIRCDKLGTNFVITKMPFL